MTLIVGCDPSTKKIALVWHDTVTLTSGCVTYKINTASQSMSPASLGRAQDHMDTFVQMLAYMSPTDRQAWVEDPLVGKGGIRSTMVQAYVGGIIRASLHNAGFDVHDVHPSTWKKAVCGTGAAKKPDVARTIKVAWPKVHHLVESDGDLTDAAAIALYGHESLQGRVAAPARRRVPKGRSRPVLRPPRLRKAV